MLGLNDALSDYVIIHKVAAEVGSSHVVQATVELSDVGVHTTQGPESTEHQVSTFDVLCK